METVEVQGRSARESEGPRSNRAVAARTLPYETTDRNIAVALGVAVMAAIVWVWWAPLEALTLRSSDDAYYYFQVARNWTSGHGPTFDGIHPTNGFHPLWMLVLLPIYAAWGSDPVLALRIVFSLVFAIAGVTAWVGYRVVAWHAGKGPAALAVLLLASPPFLNPMINGLETGVLLLLTFLFLDLGARRDLLRTNAGFARDALLGALLGLLFLTRLDSVFIVLSAFAAIGIRWVGEGTERPAVGALWIKWLRTGAVAAAYAVPYLLWNRSEFGHWMPISGALKNAFPEWSFSLESLGRYHGRYGLALLGIAALAFSAYATLWHRRGQSGAPPRLSGALFVVAAGCVLHFANTLAFLVWGVNWWHYAGYAPLALVSCGVLIAVVAGLVARPAWVLRFAWAAVALFVIVGHVSDSARRGVRHERWLEGALWASANLPADAIVGMTDCGLFGYFCGRPTVNLDGVINGYEYQEALRDHRLTEFLDRSGVTHVATHAARYRDGEYLIWLPSRLYRTEGGAIVGREGHETYRSAPFEGVYFSIWKRDGVRVLDDVGAIHRTALSGSRSRTVPK